LKVPRLKETVTPAGKLYNWNIVSDMYNKIDIPIENDHKSLIIAGDLDITHVLLTSVFKNCGEFILREHNKVSIFLYLIYVLATIKTFKQSKYWIQKEVQTYLTKILISLIWLW